MNSKKKTSKVLLKDSEEKLRSIFSAAPLGIGLVVDRVLIEVNDTLCMMTGYSREELVGKSSAVLYPDKEEFDYVGKEKYVQIQKYGMGSVETRFICRNGNILNVVLNSTPLDNNDLSKGVTFTVLDITYRHKIEADLKSSLSILNASLESTADGILISDGKGKMIKWNHKFAEMWEMPEDVLHTHNEKDSINYILNKLVDPDKFLGIVTDLYAKPAKSSFDKLEFKDGRIFERYSQAQYIDNDIVGRVWSFRDVTNRYKAEESLKVSEEKFRSIAENLTDVIFITDKEGKISYISPSVKIFGYTPDECIGNFFGDFLEDSELGKAMNFFTNALNSVNINSSISLLFKRKDGTVFFAELSGSDFTIGNETKGVLGLLRDVSEKMNREIELRKLSRAVEQSLASIVITDSYGNIEYVNSKLCELTGYSKDEIMGENPRIMSSGESSKEEYASLWKTITEGNDWKGEFHNKKKNGDLYWESALISPIKNENGEITHYLGIKEDITEKKKMEASVIASEQRYRELFLDNPVPTYIFDENSLAFLEVNNAAIYSYGYSSEEFLSMTLKDIRTPEDIPALMESLLSLDNNVFQSSTMRHRKKDGTIFPVEITSHPLPEKNGIRSRLVMSMDITERIMAADQMKIAREKAEASDKLKTMFLNNISHEVRTPLNGIIGFAELISQPGIGEEDKLNSLRMLSESSDRLLDTITSYMDISLITSGSISVQKKYFAPADVFRSLYSKLKPQCLDRNLELILDIPKDAASVKIFSDPEIFRKIISHLLNNAIKFTDKGSIRFGYLIKDKQFEVLIVDTGIGIGEESKKDIFNRFEKEDRGPSRLSEGSGLGLSIVKGMTELLGAKIEMKSELDKGTTFRLIWPFSDSDDQSEKDILIKDHKEKLYSSSVLIAEDDDASFIYLKTLLSRELDAKILHARNGSEAVSLFKDNPDIKLILMDIKMPELNGIEATRAIKAINKNVPVIAITAYAMSGDEDRITEGGCDGYISKPITKDSLFEKIAMFIELE